MGYRPHSRPANVDDLARVPASVPERYWPNPAQYRVCTAMIEAVNLWRARPTRRNRRAAIEAVDAMRALDSLYGVAAPVGPPRPLAGRGVHDSDDGIMVYRSAGPKDPPRITPGRELHRTAAPPIPTRHVQRKVVPPVHPQTETHFTGTRLPNPGSREWR